MRKQSFDRQWQFTGKGQTTTVDLPHDYSISQKRDANTPAGPGNGYFPGGVAKYEKKLFVPAEWKGERVLLEFEGVYMNAVVRVNKSIVARQPYGYTSFHCDLTPYLLYDADNMITVHVNNNALPNSRWYSGSGIYRHVWLMVAKAVHIAPYGISVTTPDASAVTVETTFENKEESASDMVLRSSVYDAEGELVASDEVNVAVSPGESKASQTIALSDVKLWSPEAPYLYTLRSELLRGADVTDSTETIFGVRTVAVDAVNGFQLNGKTVKLKGGCVHHDCGLLGAAAFDRAEERKVELLKNNGYNAVRCAHNPPSPAFLDACDRLGLIVMDEAFDCWREGKNPNDYNVSFDEWWKKDMAAMVLRDRNHPSVAMWSTGNEIPERDGRSEGYATARELAEFVRALDPTRPVANALCAIWGDGMTMEEMEAANQLDAWANVTEAFAAPLDIVGYNYLMHRYVEDGKRYPNRVIAGTETFPMDIFDGWEAVEKLPYLIGDFVWTSLDYLGEAGIGHVWYDNENTFCGGYPWNQAFCGDIDVCGFKRPQSYYRDFVWGEGTVPYIAVYKPEFYGKQADISRWGWPDVVNSWSWPGFEGKPVEIEVYAGGDEVELIQDGKSLGRKASGKAAKYTAKFETMYTPGELVAVSYANGAETGRSVLKTASAPAAIRLTPDREKITAKYGELVFVTVELLDKEGNPAHHADNNLYFNVSGAGSLQAVGNGNPKSEEMYVGAARRVHEGKAMVVVKACGEEGRIVLHAATEGIPAAEAVITCVKGE